MSAEHKPQSRLPHSGIPKQHHFGIDVPAGLGLGGDAEQLVIIQLPAANRLGVFVFYGQEWLLWMKG